MAFRPLPGLDVPIDSNGGTVQQTWYEWFQALSTNQSAWTPYTPTITASAGTFTSVSATGSYLQIGKLVHLTFSITITTVGTATSQILATYPIGTPKRGASLVCLDHTNGTGGFGIMQASSSNIIILRYDGGGLINAGHTLVGTGIYEAA